MKYTGRTSRNINIKALGLLLCILVASYGIIKAPASDTRKLEADLREKQQLINEEKGKKVEGTSTLPSQPTSALHTAVPADNMPADTSKEAVTKRHLVTVIGDSVFLGASVAFQQQCENAVVAANKNVQRIYWSKEGVKHPDWFYQDGVHLNPHGEKKYARFIMQMIQSSLD